MTANYVMETNPTDGVIVAMLRNYAEGMTLEYAIDNRPTDDVIVVTFRNWTEHVLYDSRKTPYDIPLDMRMYPVESVNMTDNLTIIEI